jgi:hypothetical protein
LASTESIPVSKTTLNLQAFSYIFMMRQYVSAFSIIFQHFSSPNQHITTPPLSRRPRRPLPQRRPVPPRRAPRAPRAPGPRSSAAPAARHPPQSAGAPEISGFLVDDGWFNGGLMVVNDVGQWWLSEAIKW